jgi:hypothetical protein
MHLVKKVLLLVGVALFSSNLLAADNYVPPKESAEAGGRRTVTMRFAHSRAWTRTD